MTEVVAPPRQDLATARHARWVRVCHWTATIAVFTLAFTGFVILMAHPRLYWGDVGNDLTPALLELPISRNYKHAGYEQPTPLLDGAPAVVSANRTYDIFNQNGWGRSLHFLAAWFLAGAGAVYLIAGLASGHFRRHVMPRPSESTPPLLWADLLRHLRRQIPLATGGPQYGLMQKVSYSAIVFVGLPVVVLTGLAMSPRVAAAMPLLRGLFGGHQSARTIHFFAFVAIVLFVIGHVAMVVMFGFKRQMRGMTLGE